MYHKSIDMTGQVFGRLKVIKKSVTDSSSGNAKWLCVCECGTEVAVRGTSLRQGVTKSCGCLFREVSSKVHKTHGLTNTNFYRVWTSMRGRCNNPKHEAYLDYGGSGIKVCERWDKFENFYDDMFPSYKEGLTIERINNDGHYEPSNCKWATMKKRKPSRRDIINSMKVKWYNQLRNLLMKQFKEMSAFYELEQTEKLEKKRKKILPHDNLPTSTEPSSQSIP